MYFVCVCCVDCWRGVKLPDGLNCGCPKTAVPADDLNDVLRIGKRVLEVTIGGGFKAALFHEVNDFRQADGRQQNVMADASGSTDEIPRCTR